MRFITLGKPVPKDFDVELESSYGQQENHEADFPQKKLDSWEISDDTRSRFLELVCRGTCFPGKPKPPNIDFYLWHLQDKLHSIRPLFESQQFKGTISIHDATSEKGLDLNLYFEVLFALWQHAEGLSDFSLETAAEYLRANEIIITCEDQTLQSNKSRQLVFFGLGFLSMLYQPTTNLNPDAFSANTLQVEDHDPGNLHCYGPFTEKDSLEHAGAQKPFRNFIGGFGIFLPERPLGNNLERMTAEILPPLYPAEFNALILESTCGMKFAWTDILDAHLEYDEPSKTLYIFRFPGFCMLNIPTPKGKVLENILHRCVPGTSPIMLTWARSHLSGYMGEILLSTHLLFGQTKAARKSFNPKDAFPDTPKQFHDPILQQLCCHEWDFSNLGPLAKPKKVYDIRHDFPVLQHKLRVLNEQLERMKPKKISQLWRNNRDMYQWYTFWAVIFIGCFSLFFAIIQTSLAAAQVYYAMAQRGGQN